MRVLNPKKILVSTLILIFSSLSTPGIAQETQNVPAQVVQESVSTQEATSIHMSIPRIVDLSTPKTQETLLVRSVDSSVSLMQATLNLLFSYHKNYSNQVKGSYGEQVGAYVWSESPNVQQFSMKNSLQEFLIHPENHNVSPQYLNALLGPKIISDSDSRHFLLLIGAWDFAKLDVAPYSMLLLSMMLTRAYADFQAYSLLATKHNKEAPLEVHTCIWGSSSERNSTMSTVVQMLAASLAGIDKLLFHTNDMTHSAPIIAKAKDFLQPFQGKPALEILEGLVKVS